MGSALLVPVCLDALYLDGDRTVAAAVADFSKLPFFDGRRDVDSEVPYLSESVVAPPFHDQNLVLKAGVHLHWALPDALTKGVHDADGTAFPAVPTCWLVTRSRLGDDGQSVVEQRWVVESDYLYPPGAEGLTSGVAFPLQTGRQERPYRFLGRAMPLAQWLDPHRDGGRTPEYLDGMTAMGYGHPAFAALYPNCHSVFGFYDAQPGPLNAGLQYDVIGWYRTAASDHLGAVVRDLVSEMRLPSAAAIPADTWLARVAEVCGWAPRVTVDRNRLRGLPGNADAVWHELHVRRWLMPVDDDTGLVMAAGWRAQRLLSAPFQDMAAQTAQVLDDAVAEALGDARPERMLCFGRLRIQPEPGLDNDAPGLAVMVGNTGPEALATYLAAEAGDRAATVARQLEAVLSLQAVSQSSLDVAAKLAEAHHEKTFRAMPGETHWTVSSQQAADTTADAEGDQTLPGLPPDVGAMLAELNKVQYAYDRAQRAIEALRGQIFADWYKYLLCAYPPNDEIEDYPDADTVRAFVETKGLAALDEQLIAAARLDRRRHETAERIRRTLAAAGAGADQAAYTLRSVAGPRYYQPTEPAVLLVGDAVTPSSRYGQDHRLRPDDLLETRLMSDVDLRDPVAAWARLDGVWQELAVGGNAARDDEIGFAFWRQTPWHPVLLEWEAEFFPRAGDDGESGYQEDYVNASYRLDSDSQELVLRDDRHAVAPSTTEFYSGTSILTPFAAEQTRVLVARYLVDLVLRRDHEAFFAAVPIAEEDRNADFLAQNVDLVVSWYADRYATADPDDPVRGIAGAYRRLAQGFPALSQALSGFNEALLAQRQTTQLPVADPLGFAADLDFASRVASAVRHANRSAPMPLNDFNPIRAGALRLTRLRLVDSFGQVRDVACDRLLRTESLCEPGNSAWIGLPPRLTQPARLNLRWLAATSEHTEAGAHPVSTPVCGWLVLNHLDGSLAVYDQGGTALGQVDPFAGWESAPGAVDPVTLAQIHDPAFAGMNSHLRRVAARLTVPPDAPDTGQRAFLAEFTTVLESALDTVEPVGGAQQQGLALLFSRPVAVARAAVDLQLRQPPAIDQSWPSFDQDLRRATRNTRGFTGVRFPVRIGSGHQLDDGLLGFWKRSTPDTFYAVLTEPARHDRIVSHETPEALVQQAIDAPAEELTLLLDPRGKVHATSGVLPTKAIDIPPEQYTAALAAIEVTFLTAPLVTPHQQIRLSLPVEPGYSWSWLAAEPSASGRTWVELSAEQTITRDVFLQHFPTAQALWTHLLDPAVRWLLPAPGGATVPAVARRASAELLGDFAGMEHLTDQMLGIDPATGAVPTGTITMDRFGSGLPAAADVWDHLTQPETGWLVPLPGEPVRARVVPPDQRPGSAVDVSVDDRVVPPALAEPYGALAARVTTIFDLYATGIAEMRGDALFTGPQEIREGWLALRPAQDVRNP